MLNGIGSLLNTYNSGMGGKVNNVSQVFDYKAAQKKTQAMLDQYKANNAEVKALSKDSADFLKQYTSSMNATQSAAGKLTNGGLDKMLHDKDGNVTDETVKATVSSVQDMVEAYNQNLQMLSDNEGRGAGVTKQMDRLANGPAGKNSLDMAGITKNEDGTLALNTEKLTAALKSENPNQRKLYEDVLGGANGIAANVKSTARAGLNASAGSLIGNDIAKMQSIQQEDPLRTMAQSMKGSGAYAFNNQAAAGLLMNFAV